MIRRLAFVVLGTALIVSACGRQVTPDRANVGPGGLPAGYMSVKFRVAQPFNFSNYKYVIVFNTTGDGNTPLPLAQQTNFRGYSFAIIVSAVGGAVSDQAVQYARPLNASQAPAIIPIPATQQQLQPVQVNTNGANTEFTIIFQRIIASGAFTPGPTATASATASPTPTATPSPSPLPSGATATPSPTASPVPTTTPVPPFNTTWLFNYLVTDLNNVAVDSLGQGGANDTSFVSPSLNTNTVFDIPVNVRAGTHPSDQAAVIAGGEIANNP